MKVKRRQQKVMFNHLTVLFWLARYSLLETHTQHITRRRIELKKQFSVLFSFSPYAFLLIHPLHTHIHTHVNLCLTFKPWQRWDFLICYLSTQLTSSSSSIIHLTHSRMTLMLMDQMSFLLSADASCLVACQDLTDSFGWTQ